MEADPALLVEAQALWATAEERGCFLTLWCAPLPVEVLFSPLLGKQRMRHFICAQKLKLIFF